MANETKEILHILGPLTSLGNAQTGCETIDDPVLGFKMWGGKDSIGGVTKWLAKDKPGRLSTLGLIGATTTGKVGFLKHDEDGNITGGHSSTSGIMEITDADDVNFSKDGTNDGKILVYNHSTGLFEAGEGPPRVEIGASKRTPDNWLKQGLR